jgi:hypothetical protein
MDIKETKFFKRMASVFEDSFVNKNNEFIALLNYYPSDNLSWYELMQLKRKGVKPIFVNEYFRLEDCHNEMDLKKKILAWLSRACCKSQYSTTYDDYIHQYFRDRCNDLLGTFFNEDDWEEIYCYLGNAINDDLSVKFIESNYDLDVLKKNK